MATAAGARVRQLDWLLRVRQPAGAHGKYLSWLDTSSGSSDAWALGLYALVCAVMSASMLGKAGTSGVPSPAWLLLGLAVRLVACLGPLALLKLRQPLYLRWRSQLLIGAQLTCHFSGLLLEAPATFWIQPAKGRVGFMLPIVGQVFEMLGFRVSFKWHLIRALIDFSGSMLATWLNVHWGWATPLLERTGLTKHWEFFFFVQYIVSGLGLMTAIMYFVERRSVLSFLRSTDSGKLHALDGLSEGEEEAVNGAGAHLHGALAQWAQAHARWVPVCKTRVLTLKFNGPDFASLVQSQCEEIRQGLTRCGLTQSLSSSAGFFEGCIQMVMKDHVDIAMQSPAESYLGSTSSGATSRTDEGSNSPQSSMQSCASGVAQDRVDILRCAQAVPAEWLTSGSVCGYSDSLGPFEVVAENSVPAIVPLRSAAGAVKVLSVEPPCIHLGSKGTRLRLVCQLSPGDPVICMQDGQRVPVRVLHVVRLDTPTGDSLHQVTVDVQPKLVGYLEFFVVAKAPIVPTRVMDPDSCADAVYGAVGQDLAGARALVGTMVSPPAPLMVLDNALACEDIRSLVSPISDRCSTDSHQSSSSPTHRRGAAGPSSDSDDSDDSCGSSKMHMAHNFQSVAGFQHYPLENVSSSGTQCMSMKFVKRFQQVAPTLTLCGVANTYFRLCADSKPSSYQERMKLLVSQDVSSAAEWQQLVGSCILFMARNGLQHATTHFLRQAAAYNSCGDITNLLHYAVASGSASLVQSLVREYGSSISCASDFGTTPLHLAAVIENPDILVALLGHPGNVEIAMTVRDMHGKTAYNYACEAGLQSNVGMIEASFRQHRQSSSDATFSN